MSNKLTRKKGGMYLGEGKKGIVYDLGCISEGESFCSIIKNKVSEIISLKLYTLNGQILITSINIIEDFIQYIDTIKHKIAKIMKQREHKGGIDGEILQNLQISRLLEEKTEKYTTISLCNFKGLKIAGCAVNFNDKTLYVVFGSKCNNKPFINLDKLIKDVLDCLNIIQKRNLIHNDIKDDNIVLCDDTYKLIDWGNSSMDDTIRNGFFSGFLKTYLVYDTTPLGAVKTCINKISKKDPHFYKSEIFQQNLHRIFNEFNIIKHIDKQTLFKTYKKTHDLFSFGMTIIQIVYKHNLSYERYKPLIEMLTSYLKPPTIRNVYHMIRHLK